MLLSYFKKKSLFKIAAINLFLIFCLEVYLELDYFVTHQKSVNQVAAIFSGHSWDERTGSEAIKDLRSNGENVYPRYHHSSISVTLDSGVKKDIMILGGLSKSKILFCKEAGVWQTFSSDEHGFNNPLGLYKPDDLDIAFIGDSFVQGVCVPPENSFGGQIRKVFPKTLVFDDSTGDITKLARFQEYVLKLRPKVVLWSFFDGNDMIDLDYESRTKEYAAYLDFNYSQNLYEIRPNIDHALRPIIDDAIKNYEADTTNFTLKEASIKALKLSLIRQTFKNKFQNLRNDKNKSGIEGQLFSEDANLKYDWDLMAKIYSYVASKTRSWGGELYIVYIPSWPDTKYGREKTNYTKKAFLNMANRLNIKVIEAYQVFDNHPDPLSFYNFRINNHYNEEGYRVVSDFIIRSLIQHFKQNEGLILDQKLSKKIYK